MPSYRIVVLMPVFRDWASASLLCQQLDEQLHLLPLLRVHALLVDDGTPEPIRDWTTPVCERLESIQVLHLRRNMGHQRAIAIGLCYIFEYLSCDLVMIMDADGEDRPDAAMMLAQEAMASKDLIVFAERGKRMEGAVFQAGYSLFRIAHRLLTGIPVRVGNFSIVPFSSLNRLVCMAELWNHYAGAVFKSKLAFRCIRLDRGHRLRGQSQMNLVSLVSHGFAGIAVFHEAVATRILLFNLAGICLMLAAIAFVIAIRIGTNLAVPGWATYTVGLLLVLVIQFGGVAFSLTFSLIVNRANSVTIPIRDYSLFVDRTEMLWSRDE